MSVTVLDWIQQAIEVSTKEITLEEFAYIRRNGTPEEIQEAVERMEAAGGYDNLE